MGLWRFRPDVGLRPPISGILFTATGPPDGLGASTTSMGHPGLPESRHYYGVPVNHTHDTRVCGAMVIVMRGGVVYGGPLLGLYIRGQVSRIYTSLFWTRILYFLI